VVVVLDGGKKGCLQEEERERHTTAGMVRSQTRSVAHTNLQTVGNDVIFAHNERTLHRSKTGTLWMRGKKEGAALG
jgi:hypothetical protein